MKNLIYILIICIWLVGCSKQPARQIAKTETQIVKAETLHICNAATKEGGNCKRKVKDEGFCYLHKGEKK